MITVKNSISTCLRKKTVKGAPVLACNILEANYIDNLVQHDDGYRVLRGVRNSPSHWEAEKKKVLGMTIRSAFVFCDSICCRDQVD